MRLLQHAPLVYEVARFMMRHRIRGGARLMAMLEASGRLAGRAVLRAFANGTTLYVPLGESYDIMKVRSYERKLLDVLRDRIAGLSGDVTLIDCGADIGLITAALVDENLAINRVFAFEPNRSSFELLKTNARLLNAEVTPLNAAVSDFIGSASLKSPSYDETSYGKFIVPNTAGDIDVVTIDHLGVRDLHLVLKIDVEGAELNVVRGARSTIHVAQDVVVAFEANPRVVKRTGIDPSEVIRVLNEIRPFSFTAAEDTSVQLESGRPFFDQVGLQKSYVFNVVGISQAK
jgi:FkbM family methyltransferase